MVSVIMPAYNSAAWIEAAIRSVMVQTFTDWQLIVADDGSTDSTPDIVKTLVEEDSRISVIPLSHQGVANVRNTAIEEARGEYLAFIDSDDIWPRWNLQLLMKNLSESAADISCGKLVEFDDADSKKVMERIDKEDLRQEDHTPENISGVEAVEKSLYQRGVSSSLSGKVFRRELFDGCRMNSGEIYEDLDLFYRVALGARNVAVSNVPVYFYRQRRGSIIHTFSFRRLDVLKVTQRMVEFVKEKYPSLLNAALDRRFAANFNMLVEITRHLDSPDLPPHEKAQYEKSREKITSLLRREAGRELRNGKVRLKNRLGALLLILIPSDAILYKIARL